MATARPVMITGASTGIGRAIALHLDQLGLQVFAGVRRPDDAAALQQQASPRLTPIFIDVTAAESIAEAVQQVEAALPEPKLAGLVNNAGIATGGPLEFLPLTKLREQFEINVIGQIAVTQAFLPLLRQGRGRVINMSSISGRVAMPFFGPYSASKFALEALTDSLRGELRPWGIDVISVQPGAIATPIWEKSVGRADTIRRELPPQAETLYGPLLSQLRATVLKTGGDGLPPEAVASVVETALFARRPKTRYLVGRDAKIGALLIKILPDRLRDWLVLNENFIKYT